ncbi:MAG: ROK family protein [Bacteroidetes bacterium]|nr:ROK family protein [Bacteroidota bacterium]
MAIIAIDLMSTSLTVAALGKTGKIIEMETASIKGLKGNEVSIVIQKNIKKILNNFKNKPIEIKSAGLSVPGIYFSKTGTAWAPNIPGWENYPIKQELFELLIEQNIYIKIASKRTCDILGEMWLGAAKGSKNAVYLSIGSGIGAGVLIDGKILHGFNDGVGAVGWLALERPFKDIYKSRGCFENLASGTGIVNTTLELISKNKNYSGSLKKKSVEQLTANNIIDAYKLKDPIAVKVIQQCVEYWGMAAANLISSFNPEIVILGGPLFGPGLIFLDDIKTEAKKWAQPIFIEKVKFLGSKLGANAGLFGAGHLAMKKF